jgi:uncharacterized membrane protein HdeD (DUF308 family)
MVEQEPTSQLWRILLAALGIATSITAYLATPAPFNLLGLLIGIAFVMAGVSAK